MSIKKYDDFNLLLYNIIKYAVQALIIAFVALLIQNNRFDVAKLLTLTILVALILYVLDLLSNRFSIYQNDSKIGLKNSNQFMLI
jgi:hypothetical protein